MAVARLRKVGGSVMMALPPAVLDALSIGVDSAVDVRVEAGRLVVTPARRRPTLDELLARCDPEAPAPMDPDWVAGGETGREII